MPMTPDEQTARRFINDFTEFDAQDEEYHEVVGALADMLAAAHKAGLEEGWAEGVAQERLSKVGYAFQDRYDELRAKYEQVLRGCPACDVDKNAFVEMREKAEQLTATQTELSELRERFERLELAARNLLQQIDVTDDSESLDEAMASVRGALRLSRVLVETAALAADKDGGGV